MALATNSLPVPLSPVMSTVAGDGADCDVREQPPQRGPLHVGSGVAAVVVLFRQHRPLLAGLAADVRFAGFPLGVIL